MLQLRKHLLTLHCQDPQKRLRFSSPITRCEQHGELMKRLIDQARTPAVVQYWLHALGFQKVVWVEFKRGGDAMAVWKDLTQPTRPKT